MHRLARLKCLAPIMLLVMLAYCKSTAPHTQQLDPIEQATRVGIAKDLSWQVVGEVRSGAASQQGWSGPYLPTYRRGTAHRYLAIDQETSAILSYPETLWEQLQDIRKVEQGPYRDRMHFLSAAEKWDLLFAKSPLKEEILNQLKEVHTFLENDPIIVETFTDLQSLHEQAAELENQLRLFEEALAANQEDYMQMVFYHNLPPTDPEVALKMEEIASVVREIATTEDELVRLNDERRQAQKEAASQGEKYITASLEGLKQVRDTYPLLAEEWEEWFNQVLKEVEPWESAGIARGWAAASIALPKPKSSVLAIGPSGREIFFTEGDIRALIAKAWARQMPTDAWKSAGSCSHPRQSLASIGGETAAEVCYKDEQTACNEASDNHPIHVLWMSRHSRTIAFSTSPYDPSPRFAHIKRELGQGRYDVEVFDDVGYKPTNEGIAARLRIPEQCTSLTPVVAHLALTQQIAQNRQGLVLDARRNRQVLSFPAMGFEMKTIPIRLKDGSYDLSGEPIPVEKIVDHLAPHRAPKTKFLLQLHSRVAIGMDTDPLITYEEDDDANDEIQLVYTLELDADKKLIGGTWGLIPTQDDPNVMHQELMRLVGTTPPNFLWWFDPQVRPIPTPQLDTAYLEKLYACSQKNTTGSMQLKEVGRVSYVRCPLDGSQRLADDSDKTKASGEENHSEPSSKIPAH